MRKILICLIASLLSVCVFADGYQYTAQCKMNSTSYVVAEQDSNSSLVIVHGYGEAANSTVVIITAPKRNADGTRYNYSVTIKNGYGEKVINSDWRVVEVSNIVCY